MWVGAVRNVPGTATCNDRVVISRATSRAGPAIVLGLMIVTFAAVLGGSALGASWHQDSLAAWLGPTALAYAVVGAVIASRRRRNPIGWLLLAQGLILGSLIPTQAFALHASKLSDLSPVATWSAWWTGIGTDVSLAPLLTALILFPDGRPPTRRWGWAVWFVVGSAVLAAAIDATSNVDPYHLFTRIPHPLSLLPAAALTPVYDVALIFSYLSMGLAAASLISRFRRAGEVERMQIKWVASAVTLLAVGLIVLLALTPVFGQPKAVWAFIFFSPLVAASIGSAVLRYRLYDIDRIISRTTSYAIVTGLLLGTYAVLISLVSRVLPQSSSLVVAAVTLTVAGLARPLLRRVQNSVDRRFNRARYDAVHTVDVFGTHLRNHVDPHRVHEDLVEVVNTTLQPEWIAVWLRRGA